METIETAYSQKVLDFSKALKETPHDVNVIVEELKSGDYTHYSTILNDAQREIVKKHSIKV